MYIVYDVLDDIQALYVLCFSMYSKFISLIHITTLQIKQIRVCPPNLKGLFTNFEYITFFSCPNRRNVFCERSILIKQL